MARKRESKPTGPRRREKQRVKDRLAHAQDDAQRLDIVETTPEEALKPARVDPSVQKEQPQSRLIGQAIRNGWATPEEKKPRLVDEMIGIVEDPEAKTFDKVAAYNALLKGDQAQFERDQPEQAAKAKGGVNVNNTNEVTVVDLGELFRRVDEQRKGVTNEQQRTVSHDRERKTDESEKENGGERDSTVTGRDDRESSPT